MLARLRPLVCTALLVLVASLLPLSTASAAPPTTLQIGGQRLTRCSIGVGTPTWCGSIRVPLDRDDASAGTITVAYAWLPATGPATGTVVAQEGGPGYPSIGTATDYLAMLGPVHRQENLLLMDQRGTGRSTRVDCPALQHRGLPSVGAAFDRAVAACAFRYDHTFRRTDGSWVHAADLFGTRDAADDLAQLLRRLQLRDVDLYGDSYGTYFSQSFLSRHGDLLRSATLDAAYETRGLDPWYRTTISTARTAFDAACARSLACAAAAPGSSWARIGLLAARLRAAPVSGVTTSTAATRERVTVGIPELVNLVNDAGYDYSVYRSLDASARALLDHGDGQPLLRQWAQDVGYDYSDYAGSEGSYSDSDYLAVACTDYPQLFSMSASPQQRRRQLAAAVRRLPAGTFAPFSTAEWLTTNSYTEAFSACLDWPAPQHSRPVTGNGALDPQHVPVLILNGDLDSLTPAAGGAHIARQIGSAARAVVAPNMVHLVALGDPYGCGSSILQRYLDDPGRLSTLDTSCTTSIPEVHTVGSYPERIAQVAPARPGGGTPARLAAVAVAAVGDAAYRYDFVDADRDLGLRGGQVRYNGNRLTLTDVAWTTDTSVSGTVSFADLALAAHGSVTVTYRGRSVHCSVSWATTGPHAIATVDVAGRQLHLPAP